MNRQRPSPIKKKPIPTPFMKPEVVFDLGHVINTLNELQQFRSSLEEKLATIQSDHAKMMKEHESRGNSLSQQLDKHKKDIESVLGEFVDVAKGSIETFKQKHAELQVMQKGDKGDLPSKEELLALIQPLIPQVENGKDADPESIAKMVLAMLPQPEFKVDKEIFEEFLKDHPKLKDIHGKLSDIERIARAALHGGGDTVKAGSNVTLTRNTDGTTTISATGGSGVTAIESPTGTVDGSNTSFTVTHTPLYIIVDGISKFSTLHYTYAAGTITITDGAPPVQYIRSVYSA